MNRSLLTKVSANLIAQVVAWMGLAMMSAAFALAQDAGAPAQPQGDPAAQQSQRTDGQIEMDVVHALDASSALKNDLITAATIQSEVTLSGTVSSDASKRLAESIAAHVDGVTKVHNNLQIGNPGADAQSPQPAPDAGEAPDADQSQAQRNMAGLPPPGPAPDAESAGSRAASEFAQQSAAAGVSTATGLPAAADVSAARRLPPAGWLSAGAAAVPESAGFAISAKSAVPARASAACLSAANGACDHPGRNAAAGAHQRAGGQQKGQGR